MGQKMIKKFDSYKEYLEGEGEEEINKKTERRLVNDFFGEIGNEKVESENIEVVSDNGF